MDITLDKYKILHTIDRQNLTQYIYLYIDLKIYNIVPTDVKHCFYFNNKKINKLVTVNTKYRCITN